jgi:hypothetical protein
MYVLLMLGGGVYILSGIAQRPFAAQVLLATGGALCLLTGVLLLVRFRWAPEFYLALMAFFGFWSVVWLYEDGFTARRIVTIVAVVWGAYGYFALRREVRPVPNETSP